MRHSIDNISWSSGGSSGGSLYYEKFLYIKFDIINAGSVLGLNKEKVIVNLLMICKYTWKPLQITAYVQFVLLNVKLGHNQILIFILLFQMN